VELPCRYSLVRDHDLVLEGPSAVCRRSSDEAVAIVPDQREMAGLAGDHPLAVGAVALFV
jgi:hypothetical protein